MRAETWMDRTPIRRKSERELAEESVTHWERRLSHAIADTAMCHEELAKAKQGLALAIRSEQH